MNEEKIYQFNEYVLGYDKGENDRSALTISKVLNGNMYVMATLTDESADVISLMLDELNKELQQKGNIIKEKGKEIERLNNIINKLEKDLEEKIDEDRLNLLSNCHWRYVLDKLQELKENKQ